MILHVLDDHFDFFFGARVDFEIGFGACLRVSSLQVLSDQEERHEEDLNHVRYEEPENEGRERIELPVDGRENIPPKPGESPCEYDEEKSHGTNAIRDTDGESVESTELLVLLGIDVAQWFSISPYFFE